MENKVKAVLVLPLVFVAFIIILFAGVFMSIEGASKNSLAAVATYPGRIQELAELKKLGLPYDLIMIISSFHCKTNEDAQQAQFIYYALEFMTVEEEEFVFDCICPPPDEPLPGEDPEPFECTCDNWESSGTTIYRYKADILSYLSREDGDKTLTCLNIRTAIETAAQAKTNSDTKYIIKSISAVSAVNYKEAIKRCGISKDEDIEYLLQLHQSGYFLQWLEDNGLSADIGGGSTVPPEVFDKYMMPVAGNITSPYGMRKHPITGKYNMHTGIDIGSAHHDNIRSVADGKVIGTGKDTYNGIYILISHEDEEVPFYSYYGHLSQVLVSVGQSVAMGDTIGIEGGQPGVDPDVGYSTGHHLHFEIRLGLLANTHTDPLYFLSN